MPELNKARVILTKHTSFTRAELKNNKLTRFFPFQCECLLHEIQYEDDSEPIITVEMEAIYFAN
jgi:hypothetical protein